MSDVPDFNRLSERSRGILLACIHDVFFNSAGEDYVTARLLWHNGMFNGFCWLAGQALEKFLKTALLVNGFPAKGRKHELSSDFGLLKTNSRGLIPENVTVPATILEEMAARQISPETRVDESFKDCIKRFEKNGNPKQRYNEIGHELDICDLHKFDFMCLHLSRIGMGLDTLKLKGVMQTPFAINVFGHYKSYLVPKDSGPTLTIKQSFENKNFSFLDDPPSIAITLATSSRSSVLEHYRTQQSNDADARNAINYLYQNSPLTKVDARR